MNKLLAYISDNPRVLYLVFILLTVPAFLINMGMLPLFSDEPTRGLVAIEMIQTGDYITPTNFAEPYLNKPPLYNWILILFIKFSGSYSEFVLRLPTVIFTIIFAATIFLFFRKKTSEYFAFLLAALFITSGRILFFESFQALIDTCYSWVTFLAFISVYHYNKKQKYLLLFLTSYGLTALGFLMKGLPSVAFQGITIIVFMLYTRNFRKLFSVAHFSGILVFSLFVGSYYYIYAQNNDVPLQEVFLTLLDQSTQRTAVEYGFGDTFQQILSFPFEMLYHFLPWTILLIVCIRKGFIKTIRQNDLLLFTAIIFIANIIIYWTSPEVYARYLLMFVPLFYFIFLWFYAFTENPNDIRKRIVEIVLMVLMIVASIGLLILPFVPQLSAIPNIWSKSLGLMAGSVLLTFLYIKLRARRLLIFAIALLIFRIGFNWFVIPIRTENTVLNTLRDEAREAAKLSMGHDLFLFSDTFIGRTTGYYISSYREKQLYRNHKFDYDALYLCDEYYLDRINYESIYKFNIEWENKTIHLIRLKKP